MELKTIIYTTNKTQWITRDFDAIYATLARAKGVTVEPFTIRYIELPDEVPTYTPDGTYIPAGTYIRWDWMKQHCPSDGHNAVCLHISKREAERIGLKHPNGGPLGGLYNRDADDVFDFVAIADKHGRSYGGMTAFEHIFIHELSHGFAHWRNAPDYTHIYDTDFKDIQGIFHLHDFSRWNLQKTLWMRLSETVSIYQQLIKLKLMGEEYLALPLDPEHFDNVSQAFGVRNTRYLSGIHNGTDWAVPVGTKWYAPADCYVSKSVSGHVQMGNYLHCHFKFQGKWYSMRVMHCAEIPPVNLRYRKGELLAITGDTGVVTGPHVHADLWLGQEINPSWIGTARGVRRHMMDPHAFLKAHQAPSETQLVT